MRLLRTSALLLMAGAALLTSCSVDDIFEGKEENITIKDKISGTLTVDEPYADYAACFEASEPTTVDPIRNFRAIDFLPDGTCLILSEKSIWTTYDVAQGEIYRFQYGNEGEGTVRKNVLTMTDYQTGNINHITLTKVEASPTATTARLCHTWQLQQGIVKMYDGKKLMMTERLEDDEVEIDEERFLSFTPAGNCIAYQQFEWGGNIGTWQWTSEQNQQLSYTFVNDMGGGNVTTTTSNVTVYFAGNNLYVEKEMTMDEYNGEDYDPDHGYENPDYDYDEDIESRCDRVVTLYKYEVKASIE